MKAKHLLKLLPAAFAFFLFISTARAQSEAEPNNTPATANTLALNGSSDGSINPAGDVDYYKVSANTNGDLSVSLDNTGNEDVKNLTLYEQDGSTIITSIQVGNGLKTLKSNVVAGAYFIEVSGSTGNETGNYIVSNSLAQVQSEAEPNNNPATANTVALNGSIDGSINPAGDVDYYKVSANTNGNLSVLLDNTGNEDVKTLTLYDQDGSTIISSIQVGNSLGTLNSNVTAGAYFIKVSGSTGNETGNYIVYNSLGLPIFSLSYTAQANGSISGAAMQTVSQHGNGSAVTAVPDPGYHFVSWSDGSTANPRTDGDVTNNIAVTASFAVSINTLSTIATGHGIVSGKITFTADAGYHVADVQIDGSSVGPVTTYTFSNLAADHSINASFAINTFALTATASANGTITPAGTATANYGSSLTYTIAAGTGYHISGVTVDGAAQGAISSYTFSNIIRNHTIKATFAVNTYSIVSGANGNGTITPNGSVTVSNGTNKKYTIKAQSGYHILDVLVDNASVGAVGTYTFIGINNNHTITASFAANNGINSMAASSEQLKNTWSLSANPNPIKSNVSVLFTVSEKGNYHITLTSVSGKVLSIQKVNAVAGANMMDLNVSNYPNGNYFITLTGNSKAKTISIVKAQ